MLPAGEWAGRVAAGLCARLTARPSLRLCLPTGDTPSPVYAALVGMVAIGRASLAGSTVILLDEYLGLPPADPAGCDSRLRRELIDRLGAAVAAYHPIRVDSLAPADAAAAHAAVARQGIDLALLGLGANGHIGLNEPGSAADSPTRVVELAPASRAAATSRYGATVEPRSGITLGLGDILTAGEIWLLVTGAAKAEVLRRALEGPESTDCPASLLRRHRRLRVVADRAAAARLGSFRQPQAVSRPR